MAEEKRYLISLQDLDQGPKTYRWQLDAAWVEAQLEGTGIVPDVAPAADSVDGEAVGRAGEDSQGHAVAVCTVDAQKTARDVLLQGHLTGRLAVPCVRCLEPARLHVDEHWTLLLSPAKHAQDLGGHPARRKQRVAASPEGTKPEAKKSAQKAASMPDEELSADDLNQGFYRGESIELAPFMREQLILSVPMAPKCREDCTGISLEGVHVKAAGGRSAATSKAGSLGTGPSQGRGAGDHLASALDDEGLSAVDPRLAPLLAWKKKQ